MDPMLQESSNVPSTTAPSAPRAQDPLSANTLQDPLQGKGGTGGKGTSRLANMRPPTGRPSGNGAPDAPKSPKSILEVESMGQNDVLKQDAGYGSLEGMMAVAQAGQDELAGYIQSAAGDAKGEAKIPPIKSLERAAEKVNKDFGGDWTQIADVIRGTIVANSVSGLDTAFDAIKSKVNVKRIKNRFKDPKENGYRDMNLVVEVPKAKMLGEVQLHVAQIQEIKSGEEHKVYERVQAIERSAKDGNYTADQLAEMKKLKAQSKQLYDDAWAKAVAADKGGAEPEAPSEASSAPPPTVSVEAPSDKLQATS